MKAILDKYFPQHHTIGCSGIWLCFSLVIPHLFDKFHISQTLSADLFLRYTVQRFAGIAVRLSMLLLMLSELLALGGKISLSILYPSLALSISCTPSLSP